MFTRPRDSQSSSSLPLSPGRLCGHCGDLKFDSFIRRAYSATYRLAQDGCAGCLVIARIFAPYANERHGDRQYLQWTCGGHLPPSMMQVNDRDESYIELFTTTERTCPWPQLKRGAFSSRDTASEVAITTLRSWIKECSNHHEPCKRVSPTPPLPTRVVEIIDATTIRLREHCYDDSPYTCLSHCWGSKSVISTTAASLAAYRVSIPWNDLPKTFQDAVDITSRLGIRYIWIDSLCIVQDDQDDWRHEGSKMCDIYSNCYLTIAASKSEDSTGGCYTKTDTSEEVTEWFMNEEGELYNVHTRKKISHLDDGFPFYDYTFPLIARAWVLQERLLSPRVVHFGPEELYWECKMGNICECSDWQSLEGIENFQKRLGYQPEDGTRLPQSEIWHQVVQEYTMKHLGRDEDIFPALQGIARSLQYLGDYYAGLWYSENFLPDLSWYTLSGKPPAVWRAPTWSWASIKGTVLFDDHVQYMVRLAVVVSIQTSPLGSDPFGQLVSGLLVLKGSHILVQIRSMFHADKWGIYASYISHGEDGSETEVCIRHNLTAGKVHDEVDYFSSDCESELLDGQMARILAIGRRHFSSGYSYMHCLVLAHVDPDKHIYTRVGVATLRHAECSGYFDWKNPSVLTII